MSDFMTRSDFRPYKVQKLNGSWSDGERAVGVAVRVIPSLDVDAGRVVEGVNFADRRHPGSTRATSSVPRRRLASLANKMAAALKGLPGA